MAKAPEPPAKPERDGQTTSPPDASSPDAGWAIPTGGFDTYRAAAVHLRRPFTPAAIKFKVQSVFGKDKPQPTGCLVVAYIDARLVVERLNLCVPHLWSHTFQSVSSPNFLLCRLTVDGITREDVGESPKGFSKDLCSDALKRAAVPFGIGVSLYALPQMKLFKEHITNGNLKVDGKSLVITDKGDEKLRTGYAKWLAEHGEEAFGPPLNHGDREGHMDAPEAAAEPASPEANAAAARARAELREEVAA